MKPKILVYVNSHIAHHLDKPIMKKFINGKIGHKSWEFFGDIVIPEVLKDDPELLNEEFFNGVSTHQYTMIRKGGTFINPMLYGLHNDFSLWNNVLHNEPDFFQEVMYIDVPYDVYFEVAKDDVYFVDEQQYDDMSRTMTMMVDKMKDAFYITGKEIH